MQSSVSKSNGKDMLDCFINIYVHSELTDWLYRLNSTTVCKMHGYRYVNTYNVLFSTLKRLLTMIQQLYIHLATVSENIRKHMQNPLCTWIKKIIMNTPDQSCARITITTYGIMH